MLKIGGKDIDLNAAVAEPLERVGPRLAAVVSPARFAVVLDGHEIISGPRTIDNLEAIADLLSAYGYPEQAEELRRGKHL